MTGFPFDIVGFDLDGTLLDTSPDLTAAVNHALLAAGRRPLTPAQVTPIIGGGAKAMLEKTLAATGGCSLAEFKRLYALLLDYYGAHLADGTRPFPGALDALDGLADRGVKLAVVTNKFERFAVLLLEQLGLSDRFACIIGGDTLGRGKAKPSPAPILAMIERCGGGRAAFVGDSVYDIDAARVAGIPSIAVAFGFLDRPVGTLGADAIVHDYAELIPTLTRLATLAPLDPQVAHQ